MALPPTERIKVVVEHDSVRIVGNTTAHIDVHIKGVKADVAGNSVGQPFYKQLWFLIVCPTVATVVGGGIIFWLRWN